MIANFFTESSIGKGLERFYLKIRPYFVYLYRLVSQIADLLFKVMTLDFSGAKEVVKNFKMPDMDAIRNEQMQEYLRRKFNKEEENPFSADNGKTPESTADGGGGFWGSDSIDSITGSAKQIKNLTVNIDAFNKGGINTQNTSLQHMDPKEIEKWFTDMGMRVVRNIELSY